MPSKWRWAFAAWLLIVVIIVIIAYLYRVEIGDEVLLALGGAIVTISAAIIGYYLNSNKEKEELTPLELEIKRGKMLIERQFIGALKKIYGRKYKHAKSLHSLPWYILLAGKRVDAKRFLYLNNLNNVNSDDTEADRLFRVWGNDELLIFQLTEDIFNTDKEKEALLIYLAQLLYKYRPRQAANGIITIARCKTILDDKEVDSDGDVLARGLQRSINHFNVETGLILPVYTLFDALDEVSDISEYFSNFSGIEAEQPFGALIPLEKEGKSQFDAQWFDEEFSRTVHEISLLQSKELNDSKKTENWPSIVAVTFQLKLLKLSIQRFYSVLLAESRLRDIFFYRGYYMFSAGDAKRKMDILLKDVGEALGFKSNEHKLSQTQGRSLFSMHLVGKIILPESQLVGVNKKRERRYQYYRIFLFVFLGVVAFGSIYFQYRNMNLQDDFTDNMSSNIEIYSEKMSEIVPTLDNFHIILSNLDELRLMYEGSHKENFSKGMLYFLGNNDIEKDLKHAYDIQLELMLLPLFIEFTANDLRIEIALNNSGEIFELLHYYMMFFDYSKLEKNKLIMYLMSASHNYVDLTPHQSRQLKMQMEELFSFDYTGLAVDTELIEMADNHLRGVPYYRLIYNSIKSEVQNKKIVDIADAVGQGFYTIFRLPSESKVTHIPYFYTKKGFEGSRESLSEGSETIRKRLDEIKNINGDKSETTRTELISLSNKIRELYFSEYIYYWNDLLMNVSINHFSNSSAFRDALSLLKDPVQSPLILFLEQVRENTKLARDATEDDEYDDHNQPERVVNNAFSDVIHTFNEKSVVAGSLAEFQSLLIGLNDYIVKNEQAPVPGAAWLESAKAHIDNEPDPMALLRLQAASLPKSVAHWGESISTQSVSLLFNQAHKYIQRQWAIEIGKNFKRELGQYYPFNVNSSEDVTLARFADFFKFDGVLDTFYQFYLSPFIVGEGDRVTPIVSDGIRFPFNNLFLKEVNRGLQIKDELFDNPDNQLELILSIKPRNLSSSATRFDLVTESILLNYQQGPRLWNKLTWPMDMDNFPLSANFFFNGMKLAERNYEGDWALFRFFNDSIISYNPFTKNYLLNYQLDKYRIDIEIKGKERLHLIFNLIDGFSLPSELNINKEELGMSEMALQE
ncbi:type VI secretion system membrane subunit TssM [uncultured Shewanella sp.]|uniref:type VI secretion system membrane subunit TssM n=1 Tax=uncultured Shewanella sp. TaxID=173975 RepID=UPI002616D00C|nr:type VI secretion system membrane subunit TssM [uncultured Shewanella sp.]